MTKWSCGMISFRDSLAVFGGHGIPRGPTEPQVPAILMAEDGPMSSTCTV